VVLWADRRDPTLPFTIVGSVVVVICLFAAYGGPNDITLANLALAVPGIPIVIILYCWQRRAYCLTFYGGRAS
jgi:hypothetical protein